MRRYLGIVGGVVSLSRRLLVRDDKVGWRILCHLDDGNQISGSLAKLGAIDIEMSELISLRTLIYELTSGSHSPDAPKVSCRILGGVGRSG